MLTLRGADEKFDAGPSPFTATDADRYVVDDPTQVNTRDERTAGVYAEYSTMGGRLTHRMSFDRTEYTSTYDGGPATTTDREALKYRMSFGLGGRAVAEADHLLNLAVENEQDGSGSNSLYHRETTSVALEYRGSFANGLAVQARAV